MHATTRQHIHYILCIITLTLGEHFILVKAIIQLTKRNTLNGITTENYIELLELFFRRCLHRRCSFSRSFLHLSQSVFLCAQTVWMFTCGYVTLAICSPRENAVEIHQDIRQNEWVRSEARATLIKCTLLRH